MIEGVFGINITLQDLSFNIGNKYLLQKINCSFLSQKTTFVLGPNGSGKSTLLKIIAKLKIPTRGYLVLGDNGMSRLSNIAYVPQNPLAPIGMSVAEYVLLARYGRKRWYESESVHDKLTADRAIELLSLTHVASQAVDTLSGGEMQRVTLARAIAQKATVLLLDEPTSSLDLGIQVKVLHLINSLKVKLGLTVIIASHDLTAAARMSDAALLLKNGQLFKFGSGKSIFNKKTLSNAFDSDVVVLKDQSGRPVVTV